MNRFEYIVEHIDGDYAHLRRVDAVFCDELIEINGFYGYKR